MRSENPPFRPLLTIAAVAVLALASCGPRATETTETPAEPADASTAGLLPLPEFTPCDQEHPLLPAKWQAVALMQDFFGSTLEFGNFVYDEGAGAFRFSLSDRYGLSLDFLTTTDGRLYVLEGGEQPTFCALATSQSPFSVPARDWLDQGAQCVGQAPILDRQQLWWKTPSGVGANWFWYNSSNRLPFRSMYYADAKPSKPSPIYEYFTFNYFPTFEEVPSTNLPEILAMCQDAKPQVTDMVYDLKTVERLVASNSYPRTDAKTIATVQSWIPGLSECTSLGALPPPWPDQVQATVFMTAVSFPPNPFPTRVFYDWTKQAQNSSLYYNPPTATDYVQVALLTGNTGYIRIADQQGGISMCERALPGPQIPNWKMVDDCECRAQIAPRTVLNPSNVPTKILWCPTDLSAKQVFWTWYSDTGTPVVFMQSNSSPTAGTGLNLADYYHWQPGSVAPPGTFDIPAACQGQPKMEVPQACHNCHLPLNP